MHGCLPCHAMLTVADMYGGVLYLHYAMIVLLQVVIINRTVVGIGGPCHEAGTKCAWDSVTYLQPHYVTGHRQLMLDCLGVRDQPGVVTQHQTHVTLVQRLFRRSRSMLNILDMQNSLSSTGAHVQIVNMEGECPISCCVTHLPAAHFLCLNWLLGTNDESIPYDALMRYNRRMQPSPSSVCSPAMAHHLH